MEEHLADTAVTVFDDLFDDGLSPGDPEPLRLVIGVPDAISYMGPYLHPFFRGMVLKLYQNRHKIPPRRMDALRFLSLLQGEIAELTTQCYEDQRSPNLQKELYDVANFAFLMGMSLALQEEDRVKQQVAMEREFMERKERRNRKWYRRLSRWLRPSPLGITDD